MNPRKIKLTDQVNLIRDKKQQVYTFTVVTFIVVIILIVGAIKPSVETMVRINSEISKKKEIRDKLEDKRDSLNQLSLQYSEFEQTADDLILIYPTNSDFSLFLANIESLSEESGFELNNISFGSSSDNKAGVNVLRTVDVNLAVTGAREGVIPFLKKLESLPMYPEVVSISFNTEEEDGLNSYSIRLIIYEITEENFYE